MNTRSLKFIIAIFFTAIVCDESYSQNLTDNLLFYYNFNGNADDVSGNTNHAIVNGATLTNDRFGNPNSAYLFNGINDFIELPNTPSLKPQLPVTVGFWVRFDDMTSMTGGQDYTRVFNSDYQDNSYTGVWIYANGGKVRANYGDGEVGITSTPQRRTKIGNSVLQESQWYHVVCVIRDATDMDIYVDCINDGGVYDGSGGPLSYSNAPGKLGIIDNHVSLPPSFMKGAIDDVCYWSRALSPAEIVEVCNGKLSLNEFEMTGVNIYPNPSSNGTFNLEFLNPQIKKDIHVLDAAGRRVNCVLTAESLNRYVISGLTEGVYFIHLKHLDEIIVKKVVVLD